jgi:hypothetical protein
MAHCATVEASLVELDLDLKHVTRRRHFVSSMRSVQDPLIFKERSTRHIDVMEGVAVGSRPLSLGFLSFESRGR